MKIVRPLYPNTFADLAVGDVFEAFGGHIYLAIGVGGDGPYNAVELGGGRLVSFSPHAEVTQLSAELHVLGPA